MTVELRFKPFPAKNKTCFRYQCADWLFIVERDQHIKQHRESSTMVSQSFALRNHYGNNQIPTAPAPLVLRNHAQALTNGQMATFVTEKRRADRRVNTAKAFIQRKLNLHSFVNMRTQTAHSSISWMLTNATGSCFTQHTERRKVEAKGRRVQGCRNSIQLSMTKLQQCLRVEGVMLILLFLNIP